MIRHFSGHDALRKGRVSLSGQVHLVTVVCQDRRRRFDEWETASAVCKVLGTPSNWLDAQAMCWVLMPDQWHALVQLGDQATVPRVMQRINSLTARAANSAFNGRGRVWQPAYHDHALRKDENALACARYVVANPLRAGLVARLRDYPYWDAIWL